MRNARMYGATSLLGNNILPQNLTVPRRFNQTAGTVHQNRMDGRQNFADVVQRFQCFDYNIEAKSGTLLFVAVFARSAYYVHATEETSYTVTQLNLAKLIKEPSATYQIHLWSQRGTKVNRQHHGDILLRSPP